VYPGFLQYTGFVAMNPDRHATSHYDYFKDLIKGDDASAEAHRKFYDEYNAVLDMDADYYLETIQTVFQEFKLVNGTWDVKGVDGKIERVRPQDIKTTALLTVEGELDDISGSGQTRAAQDLCSGVPANERLHLEVPGAGHYGIFSGRRWRDIVYPQLVKFILNHPTKTAAKGSVTAQPKAVSAVAKKAVQTKPLQTMAKTALKSVVKATSKAAAATPPRGSIQTTWVQPKKKA
jgi:poly(3-hydroxybutyrate) depolymerase